MEEVTLSELERKLNEREKQFVLHLVSGLSGTESAIKAGYSPKTAASQASRMLRNVKISAYRRALTRAILEQRCLTPESIALMLFEIYERCMQKSPVLEWNRETREWLESGVWQFDARGATRVLELLGKNAGMFVEKVQVSGHVGGIEEYLKTVNNGETADGAEND